MVVRRAVRREVVRVGGARRRDAASGEQVRVRRDVTEVRVEAGGEEGPAARAGRGRDGRGAAAEEGLGSGARDHGRRTLQHVSCDARSL